METILERHGNDVKIGNVQCKIPSDRTALSMSINPLQDACEYRPDGYVYHGGINIGRKWFMPFCTRYRLWEPKLADPYELERKMLRVIEKRDRFISRKYKPYYERISAAIPFYGRDKNGRVVCFDSGSGPTYLDEPDPACKLRQDLVDEYLVLYSQLIRRNTAVYLYKQAFAFAITDFLEEYDPDILQVVIKLEHYYLAKYDTSRHEYDVDRIEVVHCLVNRDG